MAFESARKVGDVRRGTGAFKTAPFRVSTSPQLNTLSIAGAFCGESSRPRLLGLSTARSANAAGTALRSSTDRTTAARSPRWQRAAFSKSLHVLKRAFEHLPPQRLVSLASRVVGQRRVVPHQRV